MLAGNGSARIAANSRSASAASTASVSFQGTTMVSAACAAGHSGARRDARGRKAGAGFRQEAVDVAVVRAGELQHRVAAGRRAGEAHRAHRRLGPRRRHAHHLDRREAIANLGGKVHLALGRRPVRGAALGGARHRVDHIGMRMAQYQRTPRADPVDVAVAIHVDQLEPLASLDEDRMVAPDRAHRPHGRIDAARHQPGGTRINHLRDEYARSVRAVRPSTRQRLGARVLPLPVRVFVREVVEADLLELGRGVEDRRGPRRGGRARRRSTAGSRRTPPSSGRGPS